MIGDIHGHSDLLTKALKNIYEDNRGSTVIFLGDYIDRGPDSQGVMDLVMNVPDGYEFIPLMGNHEDMFIESNYKAYFCGKFLTQTSGYLPEKYKDFLKNLHPVHIVENNIFAHAYYDVKLPYDEHTNAILMWPRFMMGEDFPSSEYHLTHGHTPFRNGPEQMPNRTNLDCAAKDGNQLCVGIYKYGYKGPVEFIMVHNRSDPVRFSSYYSPIKNKGN